MGNITKITKELASKIGRESEIALQEIAKKYGMKVTYRGGSYDEYMYKPRIEFTLPVKPLEKPEEGTDNEMLQMGIAPRGTVVILNDGKEATIIETRRTKYLIDIAGKEYVVPFRGCKLKETKEKANESAKT